MSIEIVHAALDTTEQGEVILRGVITPASLPGLQVGEYQREVAPFPTIMELVKALDVGTVPDVELGMRGDKFREVEPGHVILDDPVFIIDGQERIAAGKLKLSRNDAIKPHIGAMIHFGTTEEWERERFRILNMARLTLSPNVILRNWRYDSQVIDLIYRLCEDKRAFVMAGRVSWQQRQKRQELITAATLMHTIGRLHTHLGPTGSRQIGLLTRGLDKIRDEIGETVFRENIKTFFRVMDDVWGVRTVQFKEGAVYMRGTFLETLARVFSNHLEFWRGNRLVVDADYVRKLKLFPLRDPHIINLTSSGGPARELLYNYLVRHINSGKRTRRLTPRYKDYAEDIESAEQGEIGVAE
jgi:hypothetical protein